MLKKPVTNSLIITYIILLTIFLSLGYKAVNSPSVKISDEDEKQTKKIPEEAKVTILINNRNSILEYPVKLTEAHTIFDALEELRQDKALTYEQLDLISDPIIEDINGLKITDNFSWNLYINGEKTNLSPKKVYLKNNSIYTLKYE